MSWRWVQQSHQVWASERVGVLVSLVCFVGCSADSPTDARMPLDRSLAATACSPPFTHQHQPAGFTRFAEFDHSTVPSTLLNPPPCGKGRWRDFGSGHLSTTQTTAPVSPPNAVFFNLPVNFSGDTGNTLNSLSGWDSIGSTAKYRKVYLAYSIKAGAASGAQTFENHPILTKLNFLAVGQATGANNQMFLGLQGDGSRAIKSSWRLSVNMQNVFHDQAISSLRMTMGVWHVVELEAEVNTIAANGSANADGKLRVWVDNTLYISRDNWHYINAANPNPFYAHKEQLVWGGQANVNKTQSDNVWFDHAYMSGLK